MSATTEQTNHTANQTDDTTWELLKFDVAAMFLGLLAVAWPLLFALPLVLAFSPSAGWAISLLFYVNLPFAFRFAWFLFVRRDELAESFTESYTSSDQPAEDVLPRAEYVQKISYITNGESGDLVQEDSRKIVIPGVSEDELKELAEKKLARMEEHLA